MRESRPGTFKSKIALTSILPKVAKFNEANGVCTGMLNTMSTWAVLWGDDEERLGRVVKSFEDRMGE